MNKFKCCVALVAALMTGQAWSQSDPGVTSKEIRIGNIMPYSGPASAYGTIGKAIGAYFDKVNAEGGINGRTIKYLSLDDGYNPTKTLAQTRKLVEADDVFLIFQVLGTPTNTAIQKYLNDKKVPQLFVATGATKWSDPVNYPWTMGWQPNYQTESKIFVAHLLETNPKPKIAILYQNDDFGKDCLKGIIDSLGERAKSMVVAEASYEVTDPSIDTQIVTLKASGADTIFIIATPKFAAQTIKKIAEIGWKPARYLNSVANYVASVMIPAGAQNGIGIFTTFYLRDPGDPQWANTKEYQDWLAWMKKYYPAGELNNNLNVYAYSVAQTLVQTLKQAGNNLTRANVMKQAANLDMSLPMLLPGIRIKTGPKDFSPIEQMQLARWDGKEWVLFGKVYGD